MQLYRVKYLKCLRARKYILERKCEWNLSLVSLFLEIITFLLIVSIEWSLHTHSEQWQHFPSVFLPLAVGRIEGLPWSSWIKKKYRMLKAIYVPNDDYFVSVRLQRTNRKIGKIVALYQRELFKKIPCLGTFCIQSINEGLKLVKC